VQEHPEVPTTNIPIDPALVAKIDRLTQQGRDVLRAAAELASSVGHVMERMDEIKATTCYGDDDAINALCRVTGWDTLLDTRWPSRTTPRPEPTTVRPIRRHGTPGSSTSAVSAGKGWRDETPSLTP
jgi:hypothetical protein